MSEWSDMTGCQDIVSEWSDMSIWGLLFGWLWVRILCLSGATCLSGDCCLVGSGSGYCVRVERHVYLGTVVWLALGQDIVSEWSDMSIWGLSFGWLWVRILCLSGATCLSGVSGYLVSGARLGQDIVSEWSDMSGVRILCLSGVTCLSGDCCLVGSGSGYCV